MLIALRVPVHSIAGGGSSHDCAKGVGIVATNGGRIHDYEVRRRCKCQQQGDRSCAGRMRCYSGQAGKKLCAALCSPSRLLNCGSRLQGVDVSAKPMLPLISINTTAGTASEMTR